MKGPFTDTTARQALVSMLLASLMVTAGCSGILSGDPSTNVTSTPTPTTTTVEKVDNASSADGIDLRRVSIPDNGSVTHSGELDRGDPKSGGKYYEPVQVAAVEGQVANITMEAENGHPGLRIVDPDGNVTRAVSNNEENKTESVSGTFTQTGNYTIEATSTGQNTTFNYTLTIERGELEDKLLAPPRSEFNETEKYLAFGRDVAYGTASVSDNGRYSLNVTGTAFQSNVSGPDIQSNASADYVVITYKSGDSNNFTRLNDIDVSFMVTYSTLWESYRTLGNNSSTAENESWVPELIFLRALNDTGELRTTNFITLEWAKDYAETGDNERYDDRFGSTTRIGPGDIYSDPDSPLTTTITDEEFPQAYWNYTFADGSTLAERYDL